MGAALGGGGEVMWGDDWQSTQQFAHKNKGTHTRVLITEPLLISAAPVKCLAWMED